MSKSTKSKSLTDKHMDGVIQQFCSVTGAPAKEAKRYLEKYKRVDLAIDAYYSDPNALSRRQNESSGPSTSKLNSLFDKYKDVDGDEITVEGTVKFCEDLEVNLEDVVLLAVAYELKSPGVGQWKKKEWTEGWKSLGCDSMPAMKTCLLRLRDKLGSEPTYFQRVYNYTFEFAKSPGQRSIATDTAQAFWSLLIPHGVQGGALAHVILKGQDDDVDMGEEEGWQEEYLQWWFDFLNDKAAKGVSKDTWSMFMEFIRTVDSKFEKYDMEAAWPSTIDDFVEYAKARIVNG